MSVTVQTTSKICQVVLKGQKERRDLQFLGGKLSFPLGFYDSWIIPTPVRSLGQHESIQTLNISGYRSNYE